jgi:hypothetical protein
MNSIPWWSWIQSIVHSQGIMPFYFHHQVYQTDSSLNILTPAQPTPIISFRVLYVDLVARAMQRIGVIPTPAASTPSSVSSINNSSSSPASHQPTSTQTLSSTPTPMLTSSSSSSPATTTPSVSPSSSSSSSSGVAPKQLIYPSSNEYYPPHYLAPSLPAAYGSQFLPYLFIKSSGYPLRWTSDLTIDQ